MRLAVFWKELRDTLVEFPHNRIPMWRHHQCPCLELRKVQCIQSPVGVEDCSGTCCFLEGAPGHTGRISSQRCSHVAASSMSMSSAVVAAAEDAVVLVVVAAVEEA